MLRSSLLMAACLCLLTAPMAMAADSRTADPALSAGQAADEGAYPGYGVCYSGRDGEGETINWVKNPEQCQHSSNGQSWVVDGIVQQNFQRGN